MREEKLGVWPLECEEGRGSGPGLPDLKEEGLGVWTPGSVGGEAGGLDPWAEGGRGSYTTN